MPRRCAEVSAHHKGITRPARRAGSAAQVRQDRRYPLPHARRVRAGFRCVFQLVGSRSPGEQGDEQALDGGLERQRAERQRRDLAGGLVDDRIEAGYSHDQLPSHQPRLRLRGTGHVQRVQEAVGNLGSQPGQQRRELLARAAEIGRGKHDARADDADANLRATGEREIECISAGAAHRAEFVARDDRRGIAGEGSGVGGEIAQQRRDERANAAPERKAEQEAGPALGEARAEHDGRDRADYGADKAEPAFAQRRPQHRLADDGRGGAGPRRRAEFQPERNEKRQADGGPKTDAIEQGRQDASEPAIESRCRPAARGSGPVSSFLQRRRRSARGGVAELTCRP